MVILAGGLLFALVGSIIDAKPLGKDVELRMPGVQPQVADTYLCLPLEVKKTMYITGFEPHADMNTAHHMLLYGCNEPGTNDTVWNCGEMLSSKSKFQQQPVCKSGAKIIYAWAMDAPALKLPKDVAFKVGDGTAIKFMVLQVHYKDVTNFLPPKNKKDVSGITLKTSTTPLPKRAGVYLMGTGGVIPPHSVTYMETACTYNENFPIHPFAYRTHAHVHGMVTSGYRVNDKTKWTEIGRKSPQIPEMFYPVTNPGITIKKGDVLAARCTMKNNEDRTVEIGSTQHDEMCNFYIMYWVDGDKTMRENYCFTDGPPAWNWSSFRGLNVSGVPDTASVVPSTGEILKATGDMINAESASINKEIQALESFISSLQGAPQPYAYADYQDGEDGEEEGQREDMSNGLNVDIPAVKYYNDYSDEYNNEVY